MNEKVFFIIDGKELILDKVLVEFNEMPIFFVCKFEQDYFISSCVDIEKERYLIAKVGLSNLAKMLHGKMTMRNLILQAGLFWEITVGEDFSEDVVTKKSLESISLNELPYEGEYLTLATRDLREYAEKIDSVLYGEGVWESEVSQVCDEYFDTIIKTINEHYEIALQNCYESIINNLKQGCFVSDDVDAYIKGVCNHRMTIDATSSTKLKVEIDDNDKRSWAA
ncbi:MAG: hypothetical protein HDR00_15635 [Lachnospiraceae bacterium]|nr:hypothetical protein [Lachnospiraceae bacterium]